VIWVELLVVLAFIFLGSKLGGIGIGYAGGAGVVVLTMIFGLKAGSVPVDVILIIMSVIAAIAAMQRAGGLDYLVYLSEKILRSKPEYITFLAPFVTYIMTFLAGTGHTAFSTLPVIAEVAKENGVRPSRPLSIAVIASQIAITASPISAAVIIFASFLEPKGVSYLGLLAVAIPSTFLACIVGAFVSNFLGKPLEEDEEYQRRLKEGLVKLKGATKYVPTSSAIKSVVIFGISILCVVTYATLISDKFDIITEPTIGRNEAIMAVMLLAATIISLACKVKMGDVLTMSTFKSGMSACICVLGVAWLGDTFVSNHIDEIKEFSGGLLSQYQWLLAVVLFFASMLLYSQAATTQALMPSALALGVAPVAAVAAFSAVSALFVLPTYPTLLAAIEMDDTGSTRIGKYVFDHPFIIPGIATIVSAVVFGFIFGGMFL
jgi:anaerobic C4-dicarboxylate transporter DcuA